VTFPDDEVGKLSNLRFPQSDDKLVIC
jgi:hypothetical protein